MGHDVKDLITGIWYCNQCLLNYFEGNSTLEDMNRIRRLIIRSNTLSTRVRYFGIIKMMGPEWKFDSRKLMLWNLRKFREVKPTTIATYRAAIVKHTQVLQLIIPWYKNPLDDVLLLNLFQSMTNTFAQPEDRRTMTTEEFVTVMKHFGKVKDHQSIVVMSLLWYSLIRPGALEFIRYVKREVNSEKTLNEHETKSYFSIANDVIFSKDGKFGLVRCVKDKNVQRKPRFGGIPPTLHPEFKHSVSPVGSLNLWIKSKNKMVGMLLDKSFTMKDLFQEVNSILETTGFTAYSMRRGGATEMLESSKDLTSVQYAGGWKCADSVKHYITQTPKFLRNLLLW
jgi:hypothetical protein